MRRPIFIVHGTADTRVKPSYAADLAAAVRPHGGTVSRGWSRGPSTPSRCSTSRPKYERRLGHASSEPAAGGGNAGQSVRSAGAERLTFTSNVKVVISFAGRCQPCPRPRAPAADQRGRRRDRPDDPRDPLLRGDRPARAGRPVRRRLPPVRRVGPRSPPVHPEPARRRRVLARPDRPAARGRRRPRAQPRRGCTRPATPTSDARSLLDARARVDHQIEILEAKAARLATMIDEAQVARGGTSTPPGRASTAARPRTRIGRPRRAPAARDEPHDRRAASARRAAESNGMRAFRHRNYRLFFAGQAISLVGTWMQQVAQAWLVLELTHDPIWLGIVAAAQFIPVMVLGLFAGRRRRRPAQAPRPGRDPDRDDGPGRRSSPSSSSPASSRSG